MTQYEEVLPQILLGVGVWLKGVVNVEVLML